MAQTIKIGTRGSNLALWQTRLIEKQLKALYPDLDVQVEIIKTTGDIILDKALSKIEGKGLFTKEIEDKLLDGSIDLAVHSLKDMPTELPEGLTLAAITTREDPSDALLSKNNLSIAQMPKGSVVLTSSLRRKSQLLHLRPDLQVKDIRGNIDTRINKFQQSDAQAMLLATAGMVRLELDMLISQRMNPQEFIPACGQGALAIETRLDDNSTAELLKPLDDNESRITTLAERSFLAAMGGGCQLPMGAYSYLTKDQILHIKAMCGESDSSRILFSSHWGPESKAIELGQQAAEDILSQK